MSNIAIYRRWLQILGSLDEVKVAEAQDFTELCGAFHGKAGEQAAVEQSQGALEIKFREFLASHPAQKAALREKLILEALEHVDTTIERYARIKAQRPLTEDEKQIGPVLMELMSAARRLLRTR